MNQTVSVVVGAGELQRLAQDQRLLQARAIEVGADVGEAEIEDAHGDAADLEVAYTDGTAVGGLHGYYVALFERFRNGAVGERSGEHPWMEAVERLFFAALEAQHGVVGLSHYFIRKR